VGGLYTLQNITATARRMPHPVDGDEGGRMEIEIYLPMQSISPALWAGLLTLRRIL